MRSFMRLNKFLLSTAVATAIAALVCGVARAQPITIEAGHTVLTLPAGMQSYSAPLARQFTSGDPVRIERQVVLLSTGTRPPAAALLIESTREAGRYIWTESCKQMRNDAHTFVHSPFHAMGNECTFAVGPVDLAAVIGQSFPDIGQTLRSGGQAVPEGAGYVIRRHVRVVERLDAEHHRVGARTSRATVDRARHHARRHRRACIGRCLGACAQ